MRRKHTCAQKPSGASKRALENGVSGEDISCAFQFNAKVTRRVIDQIDDRQLDEIKIIKRMRSEQKTNKSSRVAEKSPAPDRHDAAAVDHQKSKAQVKDAVADKPSSPIVNTTCPACGMEVDPQLPTFVYQGKNIGIACAACIPKLKRDIEKYGPAALQNRQAD